MEGQPGSNPQGRKNVIGLESSSDTGPVSPSDPGQIAARWVEILVYATVVLIIGGRFLTERIGILPRPLNAVDFVAVPILFLLSFGWLIIRARGGWKAGFVPLLLAIFLATWSISWLLNPEVHWLGAMLFAAALSLPIIWFLALTNLGLKERFRSGMIRLLFALLIINLVVGTVDAAQGLGTSSADFVFGTFGVNQNQFAFFLGWMIALLTAQWLYRGLSVGGKLLLVWSAAMFILAGFQTLWIVGVVAFVLAFFVLGGPAARLVTRGRLSRRLFTIGALFVVVPAAVLLAAPFRSFDMFAVSSAALRSFDELGKVELVRNLPSVFSSRPWALVVGVGPGTFNSRAFRSIAITPRFGGGATDVAGAIATPFYRSELSTQFIIPYFERGVFHISGSNTDGPFTSYVSIPVEVGVAGALALFGIYGIAIVSLVRSLHRTRDPEERILLAWALASIIMLLGISVVDNYLETTRYTLLVWLSVALSQNRRFSNSVGNKSDD